MSEEEEKDFLIRTGINCIDCGGALKKAPNCLKCNKCKRKYSRNKLKVWDFTPKQKPAIYLDFYKNEDYQKWTKVFEEQEIYDWSIYNSKFKRVFSKAGHRILGRRIKRSIKDDETLVEIGAGGGALLDEFKINNYLGLDTSMKVLAVLKKRHPNATAICVSGRKLPFQSSSIIHLVSLHTLEHIYHLAEHLQEVKRILKQNGKFYFVIPTEGGWAFYLGRLLFTGPHVRRKYKINAHEVMAREHINDARRVLKFLRFYFSSVKKTFWPISIPILSINVMIYGFCKNKKET